MPLYQFICSRCLERDEEFYSMIDAPTIVSCSKCNGVSYRVYGCSVKVPNPTHEARKGRGKG